MASKSIKDDSINKTLCEKIELLKDSLKELELIGKSLNTKLQEQISSGCCNEAITTAPITNETIAMLPAAIIVVAVAYANAATTITAVVNALTSETQKVIESDHLKIGELISSCSYS